MLTVLRLRNLKRFASLELSLRPLTTLTGSNSAGKSTVLQALNLARQASLCSGKTVSLSAEGLSLGEASEVLARDADGSAIEVTVEEADSTIASWRFKAQEERSMVLGLVSRPEPPPRWAAACGRHFTYLCAERLGPRDSQHVSPNAADDLPIGIQGEYTAQLFQVMQNTLVPEGRRREAAGSFLRPQTEAWMSHLVGPLQIDAQWPAGLDVAQLRFKTPSNQSEWTRPPHMGFGVSYVLPIVVGGLLAPSGGIFLLENPEAHLHPAGQSRIGLFLGTLAADGVQVLVETHSDHVINGIRRAATGETTLRHEDVLFHFFSDTNQEHPVTTIELQSSGALTDWPKGFFDQLDEDLGILAKVRRKG